MQNHTQNHQFAYITTCKGRLEHLSQTLPVVVAQAGPDVEIIVVDYGCPDGTADWVNHHYPNVKVVRVTDDAGFNASRARNLGAATTQAQWLIFFDADILIKPNFFSTISPLLNHSFYYVADHDDANLCGSCIVEREKFEAICGYDEAIEGYGGEDLELYAMLKTKNTSRGHYPNELISAIRHTHESRTKFHKNKNIPRSIGINHLYRVIKSDIIHITKRMPSLTDRQQLRKEIINQLVAPVEKNQKPKSTLRIALPDRKLLTHFNLQAQNDKKEVPKITAFITYEIDNT